MAVIRYQGRHGDRCKMIVTAALALSVMPHSVGAKVIEIGDDGTARTFDGPTRSLATAAATPLDASPDAYERSATRNGLDPRLLRAVAWTESRGRADAISPKGARGIMQLMPGTAAALGVDPSDPDANIAGGAAYLAQQIGRFQSIPLGLAAYNAGPGAVRRWGGIPPYRETQAYVASVTRRWLGNVSASFTPVATRAPKLNTFLIEVPDQ
ncbi:MAG: lytic transglycosylase [Sphingomonadales bacterium]|nr:lytic transglycosylase [Sphingomonadales bacterium]